jgi:hypothetical protein
MLEPDARKLACPVLRGEGHGNVVLLPDKLTGHATTVAQTTRPFPREPAA